MVEARQRPRLVEKPFKAPLVGILVRGGLGLDSGGVGAQGELAWQVFLDGHGFVEMGVPGVIGDAEAAGAEYAIQAVFAEPVAGGEGMEVVVYGAFSFCRGKLLGDSDETAVVASGQVA